MRQILRAIIVILCPSMCVAQISDTELLIGSRSFNKDLTQYMVKEYIVNELLDVKNQQAIDFGVDAVTSSGSGDLTSIIYSSKDQSKTGFIFGFWGSRFNEFNTKYQGYGFKQISIENAISLFTTLNFIYEGYNPKDDENYGMEPNIVYKYHDLTFILYPYSNNSTPSYIRILWNGFDSVWSINNMKLTLKRIEKTFGS